MKNNDALREKKPIVWIYVILIYAGIASAILIWCLSFDTPQLRGQLISIAPWFLEINFLLIIIGIALNIKTFKTIFSNISLRQWYLVSAIIVMGIVMAVFVAPRVHRIFYDENIYLNIGQTIAAQKKAAMCAEGFNNYGEYHCVQLEHNKQPYAFPHLISMVYRIFGASEMAGFLFNNFIFGLSIFTSFMLGFLFFNRFSAGVYSALIYCLIPENIIWANTTSVEPSAALFSGLVMVAGLIFLKEKRVKTLFLFSVLLSYSMQFRTESLLILLVVGLLFLLYDINRLKDKNT
ncbi:glycosyltransferase family 39 protein, partial [bacterium]|nr:glycosyltransferase family 39 protein [bacterium]